MSSSKINSPKPLEDAGEEKKEGLALKHHKTCTTTRIRLIKYNEKEYDLQELSSLPENIMQDSSNKRVWLDIDGLCDKNLLEKIGTMFAIDPLVIENLADTDQRPRVQFFDNYIYIVIKMLYNDPEHSIQKDTMTEIYVEQVSIILGLNYVISIQEEARFDVFQGIRDRLKLNKGKTAKLGADYLVYQIINAIIDEYYTVLESFTEICENIEDNLIQKPDRAIILQLNRLKRDNIYLRKAIWPVRELTNYLYHNESALISKSNALFFREIYENSVQIIENMEFLRDMLNNLYDIYLSSMSNQLNEIMRVLTLISTIFIPLTLIAGIFGMNFKNFPEIEWSFGYPYALIIMGVMAIGMIIYFKKHHWF
jgi:magnesium transporter